MCESLLLLLISVQWCVDGSSVRPKRITAPSLDFLKFSPTKQTRTRTSLPEHFQVVIPVQGVSLIPEPNPPVIYEGAGFNLRCKARKGTHLSYLWYHNKQQLTSDSPLHHFVGNMLTVDRAEERHTGSYSCMAKNMLRNETRVSSSKMVTIVVKKHLSAPRLSFTLFHNDSGYFANISCRVAYGSPPVTFQLLLNGKRVDLQQVDLLETWFAQPVTVGLDMGTVQCVAENDIQQLLSNTINLEVAPVTGTAHVQVEYLHRTHSVITAALLRCEVTTGTFPFFIWSFNGSIIPLEANSLTSIQHDQVLVLTHISPGNSGYYSCLARDSFDPNSSWVESDEVLVTMPDVKGTPLEVIVVVLCFFLLMMIIGGTCCVAWNVHPECVHTHDDHHLHPHELIHTEGHQAVSETLTESPVQEMETVFMEVEV